MLDKRTKEKRAVKLMTSQYEKWAEKNGLDEYDEINEKKLHEFLDKAVKKYNLNRLDVMQMAAVAFLGGEEMLNE